VNRLASKVTSLERKLQALELRKAGASYRTIAERLGYASASGAHKAVASALKATLREPAGEVRTLELERLDAALLAIWRRVQNGDDRAIDRLLRIMERRARMLGLDATPATKVSFTIEDVVRDIDRLEAELAAKEKKW
jgi:hypothetical protein